jgi:O-antigen/teichoic acid export membrane protein
VWLLAGVFGLSALVNVAVNFLLIPRWGAAGAGMATVLCEWLNLVVIMRLVSREFRISFAAEGLWRYLLAAAGMALVLWLASGTGLAVEILLGVLCYAGGLLVLGYLRSADMLAIRRLLAQ